MTDLPQTDHELVAQAEAAYPACLAEELVARHRLAGATAPEALRRFLINAATVYLTQKRDQAQHQAPSLLSAELRSIHQLAAELSERLRRLPVHMHDFQHSRLMQKMSYGGLGPTPRESISEVKASCEPGSPEYELARKMDAVCSDQNICAVQYVMASAEAAAAAINTKDFGGRLPDLALNRWADNVRDFWVNGMNLPFTHSVVGTDATSPAAHFCIDAMGALDSEPTKANIMTAVRYARDSAIARQKPASEPQTETTPNPEG